MTYLVGTQNAANSFQTGTWDEEWSGLYSPQFGWGYRDRGAQSQCWTWETQQRWPWSRMCSGDPSSPLAVFGSDCSQRGEFEPQNLGISGHNSPYYLQGTCKDSLGNALGGAIVQAFTTADDLFVSQIACDDRGVYMVPCQTTAAHYLVAYYPGSPDKAGSTVNTLIPARLT